MTILKACHPQKDLFLLQEHTMELGDISMLDGLLASEANGCSDAGRLYVGNRLIIL